MQQAGTTTVQALKEVLDAAWKIGTRVKNQKLTGKLHAYWVSSGEAQNPDILEKLTHSFRVAMMGQTSKEEVQQRAMLEKKQCGAKTPKVLVYALINYLAKQDAGSDYMFTYVGRIPGTKHDSGTKHAKTSNGSSICQLEDLLPKGVFAG
jgi:hypothetical protein